jgi:translation initiation factor IF-2
MLDDMGNRIKAAGPSTPVEILGLGGIPEAGEVLTVVPNEKIARDMVEAKERENAAQRGRGAGVSLEEIHSRIESGQVKALNLIVKTDVQGTVDAVRGALENLSNDMTRVNIIHAASGSITEGDVLLAIASSAIIIGFNSQPEPGARVLAGQEEIDIRHYDVIYRLIDDVGSALQGLLTPVSRDVIEGYATVRATFGIGRRSKAAGIFVNGGHITRAAEIRVVRAGNGIFTGSILSLRHFKDDVRELNTGLEGGIVLDGFQDYLVDDILEAHVSEQVK